MNKLQTEAASDLLMKCKVVGKDNEMAKLNIRRLVGTNSSHIIFEKSGSGRRRLLLELV
jgi:hypothetical protein